jgi:hypothetical protein
VRLCLTSKNLTLGCMYNSTGNWYTYLYIVQVLKTGPLENQLESVRRPETRLNSSECTLINCIQLCIYVYDGNGKHSLCGTRAVIFEHSSIVESWYCSTLKHENHFASLFRPLRTTARRTDWFSNGPLTCTCIVQEVSYIPEF